MRGKAMVTSVVTPMVGGESFGVTSGSSIRVLEMALRRGWRVI